MEVVRTRPGTVHSWRHLALLHAAGLVLLLVGCSSGGQDNGGSGSDRNKPPEVDAGPGRTIPLADAAVLDGTVVDDGLPIPPGAMLTSWGKVSGPGDVTFADRNAIDTTARFSKAGDYVLQLFADDGELSGADTVTITVNATAGNQAPRADAGLDFAIGIGTTANLDGDVSDDGLPNPPGKVTTTWSRVSGPGAVTFGNANAVDTTASFAAIGSYTLRLLADDSALQASDTVTITVNPPGNNPPSVNAGFDQTIRLPNVANLDGTVVDDGQPNPPGRVTTAWSKVSGPGAVTFGNASAIDTTASFSQPGAYVLRLFADDSALSASDTVSITVQAQNNRPNVNAGPDQTVLLTETANLDGTVADDGQPNPPGRVTTLWSKISGPGSVTFGNASAVDTTAVFGDVGQYVLQLAGNDSELQAADTVTITVNPPQTGGTFYAAPNGSDSNPGTLAQPWKTIRYALGRLAAGETVLLRGGIYKEKNLSVSRSGSDGRPITIKAYPGETPIVDAGLDEFRTVNNADWEVYDAARHVYRSVRTYSGMSMARGYLGPGHSGLSNYHLVEYESLAPLTTNNQDWAVSGDLYYAGPGVRLHSDGRIYIRLVHSRYQRDFGLELPIDPDPRRSVLHLFGGDTIFDIRASYIVIDGLDLRYASRAVEVRSGSHHFTMQNCTVRAGQYHVLIRGGTNDLVFRRVVFNDSIPPWISWGDVKNGQRVCHLFQGTAINVDDSSVYNLEIDACEFYNLFDGIEPDGHHVRIHHCRGDNSLDDMINLAAGMHNVEIDHNIITNAFAGIGWQGDGGGPPASERGKKWIHHNIIDVSRWHRSGRDDPNNIGGLDPLNKFGGTGTEKIVGSHTASAQNAPDPWQIYHNTFIQSIPLWGSGNNTGYTRSSYVDPAMPQHTVNNIMIQTMDDYMIEDLFVENGSQIFDGNLYWRSGGATVGLFESVTRNGGGSTNYRTLAAFKASADFTRSRSVYAPGWEASGVEADPGLDSQWRPSPSSAAASGAIDLSGKPWPGLSGERFRGALPPRAP
jgi:hypothetical protein